MLSQQVLKDSLQISITWHEATPDKEKGQKEFQSLLLIFANIERFQIGHPQLASSGDR